MFTASFFLSLAITALLLAMGHWAPWPSRLHRLAAYAYGVASILVGAAIWLGLLGQWAVLGGLAAFALIGGATTAGCYGVDWVLNAWARRRAGHDDRDG